MNRRQWVPTDARGVGNLNRGLTVPQAASLFDQWVDDDTAPTVGKPIGGEPSGGVAQAIANADRWFIARGLQCIKATRTWTEPWEPYAIEREFGLVAESPNSWGALIRLAKTQKLIVKQEHRPSERPSANRREVVWYRHSQWAP